MPLFLKWESLKLKHGQIKLASLLNQLKCAGQASKWKYMSRQSNQDMMGKKMDKAQEAPDLGEFRIPPQRQK